MDWWSHKYLSFEPWRLQFSYLSPPPLQISSLINAFISKPQSLLLKNPPCLRSGFLQDWICSKSESLRKALMVMVSMLLKILNLAVVLESVFLVSFKVHKSGMFFPDIVPIGHPIFDIINSTDPEKDWDLRLACLLLFSFDREDHFWKLYGDFLPAADECSSLLLATEEDLAELQDPHPVSTIRQQQKRVLEFWENNWHSGVPLKIKRLAEDAERFIWTVSIAQTRCISMKTRVGALVQDLNMMIPYADMLNHSFEPNCFLHWRPKDRILEVMSNAGQAIKKGEEMTINYMPGQNNNMLMERYGFSTPVTLRARRRRVLLQHLFGLLGF
ncbi:hypothetical protein IGI04_016827 [Brassica rapa subsp. trilocularis]|uniref:SET domain-containing protein n=1 Tax=Brassica rapa subsp. trilocularis TaxID=1813537 RepID=A0ABQ7MWL1_BRACM|nr:hypothetical protein IGI04_016827 [Brassica rapa subsp. trilocularis]